MTHIDLSAWRVKSEYPLQLGSLATLPAASAMSKAAQNEEWSVLFHKAAGQLGKLQLMLHAGKSKGLLLVLQGMDTAGKDGCIRSVFSHVSPLGVRAEAFGVPNEEEQRHDFLWRIHRKAPALGEMAIFNRSHYEDVLVPRVCGWIDKTVWLKRYQHIVNFEALLHDQGVTVLKCYLHISKQEQKKRLQARLKDPLKQWKLQASDFSDRQLWPDYLEAYQEAMAATSSANAPWYVIPADSKRYRDLFLAELLVHTLEKMDLAFPPKSFDVSTVQLD